MGGPDQQWQAMMTVDRIACFVVIMIISVIIIWFSLLLVELPTFHWSWSSTEYWDILISNKRSPPTRVVILLILWMMHDNSKSMGRRGTWCLGARRGKRISQGGRAGLEGGIHDRSYDQKGIASASLLGVKQNQKYHCPHRPYRPRSGRLHVVPWVWLVMRDHQPIDE